MATCKRCAREVEDNVAVVSVIGAGPQVFSYLKEHNIPFGSLTNFATLDELSNEGLLEYTITCPECFGPQVGGRMEEIEKEMEDVVIVENHNN
jgi:hypothetical protein